VVPGFNRKSSVGGSLPPKKAEATRQQFTVSRALGA
jgi:hypothetical protein